MIITILLFCLGLLLVVKGADWFTDSAVAFARASHLPEIFIGATIVSVATTLPEGVVSITAASQGYTTVSFGNAVGSIICNTGLILGLVNLIKPGKISGNFFKVKSVILIAYMVFVWFLAYDRVIESHESLFLLMLLVAYVILDFFILRYKRNQEKQFSAVEEASLNKTKAFAFFIIGIIAILAGANLLINNGIKLAGYIGVPESVIALSVIALGTSLPELATALTSLRKGLVSLSIGNIIGANILNLTMVIGGSGMIQPLHISKQNILMDLPVAMLLIILLTIPCIFRKRISRFQSFLLLSGYLFYIFILYGINLQ